MGEKVKISREIAEAIHWSIQWHRKNRSDLKTIRDIHAEMISLSTSESFQGEIEEVLNEVPTFDLAEMLIKGFEIEQTPAEKVKEYFDSWTPAIDCISNSDWTSEQKAIIGTLNRLNIKIKGINKQEGQDESIHNK